MRQRRRTNTRSRTYRRVGSLVAILSLVTFCTILGIVALVPGNMASSVDPLWLYLPLFGTILGLGLLVLSIVR